MKFHLIDMTYQCGFNVPIGKGYVIKHKLLGRHPFDCMTKNKPYHYSIFLAYVL